VHVHVHVHVHERGLGLRLGLAGEWTRARALCSGAIVSPAPSVPPLHPVLDRIIALVVCAAGIAAVVVLARVVPDPRGYGTHEQLGMAKCSWPIHWGVPCPTCGATTAACLVVHLSPLRALAVHPFGAVVAASGIALAAVAGWCLLTRRSLALLLSRLPYGTIMICAVVLFFLSWGYKYLTFTP